MQFELRVYERHGNFDVEAKNTLLVPRKEENNQAKTQINNVQKGKFPHPQTVFSRYPWQLWVWTLLYEYF